MKRGSWTIYVLSTTGTELARIGWPAARAHVKRVAQTLADALGKQVYIVGARSLADARAKIVGKNPSRTKAAKAKRRAARTHRTGGRKMQRARARYQAGKSSDAQLHHTIKRTYARRITRAGSFAPGDRRNPIPRGIDRRSVRTVKRGRARVLVGCPVGHWHPRAKGRKCDVPMRALEVKRNPGSAELEKAARTFRRWHDFDPQAVTRAKGVGPIPKTLVVLGSVPLFTYVSNKWEGRPRTYEHRTKRPHPLLCTGPDGRGLFIVGGRTRVTARGLVD